MRMGFLGARRASTNRDSPSQKPKNVVPQGDDAPYTDPAHHSGQHGAGGGGTGGGVMGQGRNEPGPTMEKENRSRSRVDLGTSEKSSLDEKQDHMPANQEGLERSRHNGHVITRRARSYTLEASDSFDGASVEGRKSGRGRSSTLLRGPGSSGAVPSGSGEGSTTPGGGLGQTGNEAHDHEDGFPDEERQQMEALLEETTGQLGQSAP